jgi:hypothetical protein
LREAHWTELIIISVFKRSLISRENMTPHERLELLEYIDARARFYGPAAVAIIGQAPSAFVEIFREALNADTSESGATFFAILEHPDTRASLLAINPSIVQAAELCRRHAAGAD